MESRSQYHNAGQDRKRKNSNKWFLLIIVILLLTILMMIAFILHLGADKEKESPNTSSTTEFAQGASTSTNMAASSDWVQESVSSSSQPESAYEDGSLKKVNQDTSQYAVDLTFLAVGDSLQGSFAEATITFTRSSDDMYTFSAIIPAENITGERSVVETTYTLGNTRSALQVWNDNLQDTREVIVSSSLINTASIFRDANVTAMDEFFNMYQLKEGNGFLFYNKSGAITIAFKRTDAMGYLSMELHKKN